MTHWRPCRRCGGRAYATRPWRQPPRLCRRCLLAVADVARRAVVFRPEVPAHLAPFIDELQRRGAK